MKDTRKVYQQVVTQLGIGRIVQLPECSSVPLSATAIPPAFRVLTTSQSIVERP